MTAATAALRRLGGGSNPDLDNAIRNAIIPDDVPAKLGQTDATGPGPAVLDLNGADDQHLALAAAATAARERIVLAAAGNFGLVNLDQAGKRAAAGRDHAAA